MDKKAKGKSRKQKSVLKTNKQTACIPPKESLMLKSEYAIQLWKVATSKHV